jgi:hypothetical protein
MTPNVGSAVDQPGEVESTHVSSSHVVEGNAPRFAPTQGWHHHGEDEAAENFERQEVSEKLSE